MQHYQDLKGADGRAAFFRADRHRARDLLTRVQPTVSIGNGRHPVYDLSIGGLSFFVADKSDVVEPGATVPLNVELGDRQFYRGTGAIVHVERKSRGHRVGIDITDGYLDLDRLVALHDDVSVRAELDETPMLVRRHVSHDYRRLCGDVVYLLRRYRRILEPYEARLASDGAAAAARLAETYALCEERFLPEWRAHWREGGALVRPFLDDALAIRAVKAFTEAVVTPELIDGPIWRRSYEKPLGYPGDYRIMSFVYNWTLEGETAYARLCHRVGIEVGRPVATRLEPIGDAIEAAVAKGAGDDPVGITSLGSGPAFEVSQFLAQGRPRNPVTFTLIDQDRGALSDANQRIFPLARKFADQAEANCLQLSFKQLFEQPDLVVALPPQHLIYCAGLVDYLPARQAQLLVAGLFQKLAPGGVLVIGNMKAGTDNVWPLKFVLDWDLVYRDEAEMAELAAFAKPSALEVKVDDSGYNYLLFLTR